LVYPLTEPFIAVITIAIAITINIFIAEIYMWVPETVL
jgi:hypothetical protein